MTTVCANKDMMVSDSQASTSTTKTSVKKIWRIRGWLIGVAGDYGRIMDAVEVLKEIKDKSPREILRDQKINLKDCALLLLSPSGQVYECEEGATPWPLQEGFGAIGTGVQGAMVAMHMGATPAEAVRATAKVDPNTGGRIVTRKI